jgi:hypothetical protein
MIPCDRGTRIGACVRACFMDSPIVYAGCWRLNSSIGRWRDQRSATRAAGGRWAMTRTDGNGMTTLRRVACVLLLYKLRHRSPGWLASVATRHECFVYSPWPPVTLARAVVAIHTVGLTLADHVAVATKSSSRRRDSEGARAPRSAQTRDTTSWPYRL